MTMYDHGKYYVYIVIIMHDTYTYIYVYIPAVQSSLY